MHDPGRKTGNFLSFFHPFSFLSFYLFNVSFTSGILIPFISPSLRIHPLPLHFPPSNKAKFKKKKKERKTRKKLKNLSWKLQCDPVSHTVNAFVCVSLFARVHGKESSVWFGASGFYYTIEAGPSLGLCLDILLLPCGVEMLQLWVCESGPFMCRSRS